MELKEYIKILQRNILLIIVAAALVGLFVYIYTARQSTAYEANANLTVVPKQTAELKNIYEYDGYYALQAASNFGITIATWLQSPDTVVEIYQKAGLEIPKNQSSKSLGKFIKATAVSNSFSVKYQLRDDDKDKAQKLAKATIEVVQNKTATINQKAGAKVNFDVIASSEPIIVEVKPPKKLYTEIGLLAGLVFGIFLAFLREYFRTP